MISPLTRRRPFPPAALFSLLLFAAPASSNVAVTECGQVVTGGTATMNADLDCSGYVGVALYLENATLEMNGFTIISNLSNTDPENSILGLPAVHCGFDSNCKLIGPGTITGAGGGSSNGDTPLSFDGALSGRLVQATDVTLENNGGTAVTAGYARLTNCTIRNNAGNGVMGSQRVRLVDSTIERNGLRGILHINGIGGVSIRGSQILDHPANGALATRMNIRNSVITGNGTIPAACEESSVSRTPCSDLYSYYAMKIKGVECGTSYTVVKEGPDGSCAND